MNYQPGFSITPALLTRVERIAALRARIQSAAVDVTWIPALQKDSRARNTYSSTAIEGNPLSLEEVRALEEGREIPDASDRAKQEVMNYYAGLRFIEKRAGKKVIGHEDIIELRGIVARRVMDQGETGRYRTIRVRVGPHIPPSPVEVSGLMSELLGWWNKESISLSPVLSSAILHYRFEAIHPFADGNGRTGRALALWDLYRRGFDTHHVFSTDEFFWEDRPRYYAELQRVRQQGDDLTSWLEYVAEGIELTMERVWARIQQFCKRRMDGKLILRPRQEQLLQLLRERGSLPPREIWKALRISKQGAMDLITPLMEAGLVMRVGTKKSGQYRLRE